MIGSSGSGGRHTLLDASHPRTAQRFFVTPFPVVLAADLAGGSAVALAFSTFTGVVSIGNRPWISASMRDDLAEVLLVGVEPVVLHIDHEQLAFVVGLDPGLVTFVQALQVVDADAVLVIAAALG
jgi:hypothetical protein